VLERLYLITDLINPTQDHAATPLGA
jgi:hypothetical protein